MIREREGDNVRKQPVKVDQVRKNDQRNMFNRLNFLFFAIFIGFAVLILRLGYLQIVKGEEFAMEIAKTDEVTVSTNVPRGRIYDRMGRILVDNEPQNSIEYVKSEQTKPRATREGEKGMLEVAEDLAKLIEKDTKRVTIGDKRDFWILLNPEKAKEKVPQEEAKKIYGDETLEDGEADRIINQMIRERITDEELASFTDEELKVLAIYREMMSGYAYSPQVVKSGDVTDEEFALVSERLSELPGVNTSTAWERKRLSKSTVLGSTTNQLEGVPRSHLNYFMARGYSRNDSVGRSYLEQYYEPLLAGQKAVFTNIKDRKGRVVEKKILHEGIPGRDLVLSVDRELELKLEKIVEQKLLQLKASPSAGALDQAFVVMLDPNNGEILSLVGKQLVRDQEKGGWKVLDYAFGTFTTSYEMGSTVKLATILTGYNEGVLQVGETKIDQPLNVGGTRKRSLFNPSGSVPVNDIQAIGRSSNVYMFRIAFSLGGGHYVPGRAMHIDPNAFDVFRNNFAQFGLGVNTGIDLPSEATGVKGTDIRTGKLMDFSIGQFDTYTALQMAQYVATIANDGYRVAPRMVKQIREPSPDGEHLGPLIQETDIRVLNRLNNTDREIEQVKKGMEYVYYGPNGTARKVLEGADFTAAGKTGTAESFKDGRGTISLSHVGYAPKDNPEVAYAVVVPHVSTSAFSYPPAANDLVRASLDAYFGLKKERHEKGIATDTDEKVLPPLETEEDKKKEQANK